MSISLYRYCPCCKISTMWEGPDMVFLKCRTCNSDSKSKDEKKAKKTESSFSSIHIPKAPNDIIR